MISTPEWEFTIVWISIIISAGITGYAIWAFVMAFMDEEAKRR